MKNLQNPTKRQLLRSLNNALWRLTSNQYFEAIPVNDLDIILQYHGLNKLEDGIYTGREGNMNEHVGDGIYLTMTWYRMTSGRYEIVAYAS